LERVHEVLGPYPHPWEIILVDDGSRDGTVKALKAARQHWGDHVRVVELATNFKQTAAMQAGIDAARGTVIATLDGDLQNDPIDIPRMVARLLNEDLDLVAGWRKNRQDGWLMRKLPSRIANRLIARATGVDFKDYGCSLKVYRADCLRQVRLYGEMHRFIPAWLATVTSPSRMAQEVVQHHPRIHGVSKYGISRTLRVVLDLLFVYYYMRFRARPGHFFGGLGLLLGALGGMVLAYLLGLKLVLGENIGGRPLLLVGFFLVIAGLQLITTGVVAEVLTRVFFESGHSRPYRTRQGEDDATLLPDQAWKQKQP
jgi:glycosyltransferase involved in cell wall biosynthesis